MQVVGVIPEIHNVFDLCRVCALSSECQFLTDLTVLVSLRNRKAEVLITECGLFKEKNGYARDRDYVHPDALIPQQAPEGDIPNA